LCNIIFCYTTTVRKDGERVNACPLLRYVFEFSNIKMYLEHGWKNKHNSENVNIFFFLFNRIKLKNTVIKVYLQITSLNIMKRKNVNIYHTMLFHKWFLLLYLNYYSYTS